VQGLRVVYDKTSQKGISSRSKDGKGKPEEPRTRDTKAKDDGNDGGQLVEYVYSLSHYDFEEFEY
jgi:hypothetical protein